MHRFLPKETDMRQLSDADIPTVTDRINATPRKCLDWRTPAQVFAEKMLEIGGRQSYPRSRRKSHFT